MSNLPEVKIGVVAVSRDCFPESLSVNRRKALMKAYTEKYGTDSVYECPVCIVESEIHMVQALEDIKKAGCNALCVYLGNFGPEISETLLAKHFDGPAMFIAAAEETQNDLVGGRGDAYCGMLNASYNLKLRNIKAYIPENPVGTAAECADMLHEFIPIARAIVGLSDLKIISFGPRPLNFLACNAPIKQLYNLGVEIEENSELDLFEAFKKHDGDERIPAKVKEMEAELGAGNHKPEVLPKLAQYELTLLDWIEAHRGYRKYVAIAGKCWPAFQTQFGFVPCYVNSRLTGMGIPVSCEVDIYGCLSEFIGTCVSADTVTLLDINNTVPDDMYEESIKGKFNYTHNDTFMGFHCGNTNSKNHPALLGALGMMPDNKLINKRVMAKTLDWIWDNWNWDKTWGWDYPMVAMTCARLGQPSRAIDALLMNKRTNTYLVNGHNYQDGRLRVYMPGNGGLLTAVAMMCAGWDGATTKNPGFPKDWNVKWEGLLPMP